MYNALPTIRGVFRQKGVVDYSCA